MLARSTQDHHKQGSIIWADRMRADVVIAPSRDGLVIASDTRLTVEDGVYCDGHVKILEPNTTKYSRPKSRSSSLSAGADLGSRRHQASHLVERKGQLADHDENCDPEKIEAVIHCRFTPNLRKACAETKLVTCN
jgi:hypothetical protein